MYPLRLIWYYPNPIPKARCVTPQRSRTMEENKQKAFEVPEDTPEFYVDSAHINTQLYGSTLLLGELREGEAAKIKVKIKVSPQMAKVLSLILSKHVREYERDVGEINIPKRLYHALGLEEMI